LDVERSLLVEAHAVGKARVFVGGLDDLGDRALARVDGLDLLLKLNFFGRSSPGFDEAVRLGSESVSIDFGWK
jgi:hypothetical protein